MSKTFTLEIRVQDDDAAEEARVLTVLRATARGLLVGTKLKGVLYSDSFFKGNEDLTSTLDLGQQIVPLKALPTQAQIADVLKAAYTGIDPQTLAIVQQAVSRRLFNKAEDKAIEALIEDHGIPGVGKTQLLPDKFTLFDAELSIRSMNVLLNAFDPLRAGAHKPDMWEAAKLVTAQMVADRFPSIDALMEMPNCGRRTALDITQYFLAPAGIHLPHHTPKEK